MYDNEFETKENKILYQGWNWTTTHDPLISPYNNTAQSNMKGCEKKETDQQVTKVLIV